ncbi:hypothetical protein J6590_027766, partial [Homalodisca vitripennis]
STHPVSSLPVAAPGTSPSWSGAQALEPRALAGHRNLLLAGASMSTSDNAYILPAIISDLGSLKLNETCF